MSRDFSRILIAFSLFHRQKFEIIRIELRENGKTAKIEIIPKNRFFGGWHFRPLKTRRKNKSWIFFNSDRVNSISMLQSASKLLSNLIRYSFQWLRNDFYIFYEIFYALPPCSNRIFGSETIENRSVPLWFLEC